MAIRYGQLIVRAGNIGDDLQSLAACQHLPARSMVFVDRDMIHHDMHNDFGAGRTALIMNGWFSGNAEAWPPAPSIHPIFVGFHVIDRFKPAVERHAQYLKAFEPIGVRDAATGQFLESLGIRTQTTYCLTLTFPRRERAPAAGKVFIVDAEDIAIPRSLRKGAIKMTHSMPPLGPEATLPFAQKLLDMYEEEASLVITTRLHTALPCMAMGIPGGVLRLADRWADVGRQGHRRHDLRASPACQVAGPGRARPRARSGRLVARAARPVGGQGAARAGRCGAHAGDRGSAGCVGGG